LEEGEEVDEDGEQEEGEHSTDGELDDVSMYAVCSCF